MMYNNITKKNKGVIIKQKMYEVLKNEIEMIESEEYRDFIKFYLDEYAPSYFFTTGASSSGKFHPNFAQGEGGLVRHTKAVCLFAKELLNLSNYGYMKEEYKDYVFMACIVHDTCKYGTGTEENAEFYTEHSRLAGLQVSIAWQDFFHTPAPELLINAITSHMGQWSTHKEDKPFTQIDRCVHLADYFASRKFIDIPCLLEVEDET